MKSRSVLVLALLLATSSSHLLTPTSRVAAQDAIVPQDLERFQGYLDAAPDGMDVWYAWGLPGGRGENVRIVDIEINWNLDHSELAAAAANAFMLVRGFDPQPQASVEHGTAVLGLIVASGDGVGISGIAHGAQLGLVNPVFDGGALRIADAILMALKKLRAGDVMLIEQQSLGGPRFDPRTSHGLLPVEFDDAVFAAIQKATNKGVTVIEPAGNGFENLDDPVYQGLFNRNVRDSGAIMVGAGNPPLGLYGPGPDRVRTAESNYGSRVDVQGWGRFVTSAGYGDLRGHQGKNDWYTTLFGATSAAAAMVAGAAALIQSIRKERGEEPLTPTELRRLLTLTGSPQMGEPGENIGPRPNLRAALEALESDGLAIPEISSVKYKKGKQKLLVDGRGFVAGESIIEIDGIPVEKMKYPPAFALPGGLSTRIVSKGDLISVLIPGLTVVITVLNPTSGFRSEPFLFEVN